MSRRVYAIDASQGSVQFGAEPAPLHNVWGGLLSIRAGGKVELYYNSSPPLRIIKSIWTGPGNFRRPANTAHHFEATSYNFCFVDHGSLVMRPAERTSTMEDGSFTATRSGSAYYAEMFPRPGCALTIMNLMVPEHMLAPRLSDGVALGIPMSSRDGHGKVAKQIASLLFDMGEEMAIDTRDQLIEVFLGEAARSINRTQGSGTYRSIRKYRFDEIVCMIRRNISDPDLSVETVIKRCRISRRYLSLLLKEQGYSFPDLVRLHRINLAKELLASPDTHQYGLGEIAAMTGFTSPSYFTRTFKNIVRMTPRDYRLNQIRPVPRPGHPLP